MDDDPEQAATPVLTEGYRPGLLAEVVGLHMAYYAPAWNFGLSFEAKVAGEMAAFLNTMVGGRDLLLSARRPHDGALLGAIAVEGNRHADDAAHLRWFIVTEAARGQGLGRALLRRAVAFCDDQGAEISYLTTFAGLDPARHLYEQTGFSLVATCHRDRWNGGVVEQRLERARPVASCVAP